MALSPDQIERPINLRPGKDFNLTIDLSATCKVFLKPKYPDSNTSGRDILFRFDNRPIPTESSPLPLHGLTDSKRIGIPMQPGWVYLRSASPLWVFPEDPIQIPAEPTANIEFAVNPAEHLPTSLDLRRQEPQGFEIRQFDFEAVGHSGKYLGALFDVFTQPEEQNSKPSSLWTAHFDQPGIYEITSPNTEFDSSTVTVDCKRSKVTLRASEALCGRPRFKQAHARPLIPIPVASNYRKPILLLALLACGFLAAQTLWFFWKHRTRRHLKLQPSPISQ